LPVIFFSSKKRVSHNLDEVKREMRRALCLRVALSFLAGRTGSLPELVEFLGYEKAMQFVLLFGGQQLTIPQPAMLVEPLNLVGASMAVLEGKFTVPEAASYFRVKLPEIEKCIKIIRAEQRELNQNQKIVDALVDELSSDEHPKISV
jgi:hypothetical protein